MSLVAVCEAPGTAVSTTTGLMLASSLSGQGDVLFAECDGSGGDVAAWAGWSDSKGWSSAIAAGDCSWPSLQSHTQVLPAALRVLVAPTRSAVASVVVREAASRSAIVLGELADVVTVADCGRLVGDPVPWVVAADVVLLLCRQASSEGATVARIDRVRECLDALHGAAVRVVVVVVGTHPYLASDVSSALGVSVAAVLADDPAGAGLVAGAWSLGRGAHRSALARSVRPLATQVLDVLSIRDTTDVAGAGRAVIR